MKTLSKLYQLNIWKGLLCITVVKKKKNQFIPFLAFIFNLFHLNFLFWMFFSNNQKSVDMSLHTFTRYTHIHIYKHILIIMDILYICVICKCIIRIQKISKKDRFSVKNHVAMRQTSLIQDNH